LGRLHHISRKFMKTAFLSSSRAMSHRHVKDLLRAGYSMTVNNIYCPVQYTDRKSRLCQGWKGRFGRPWRGLEFLTSCSCSCRCRQHSGQLCNKALSPAGQANQELCKRKAVHRPPEWCANRLGGMGIRQGFVINCVHWLRQQMRRTLVRRLRSYEIRNGPTLTKTDTSLARLGLQVRKRILGEV